MYGINKTKSTAQRLEVAHLKAEHAEDVVCDRVVPGALHCNRSQVCIHVRVGGYATRLLRLAQLPQKLCKTATPHCKMILFYCKRDGLAAAACPRPRHIPRASRAKQLLLGIQEECAMAVPFLLGL